MHNAETKNWNNFFLGLVVAILPFLGIPFSIKKIIFLLLGVLIALFSLARINRSSAKPATSSVSNESAV